jgi:hypothetical protein
MEKQPAFYKMKLVGPNCAEFITQPLQAMRELNPTLDSMIQSTEQMNKVVCEAAKQPAKGKRKIASSSAVAVHDAYLQRLKALKSDSDHAYGPLVQAVTWQPPTVHPLPPIPGGTAEEDESSLGSHSALQRVIQALPKKFHNKFEALATYLKSHPDIIRVTPTGRPIVAGVEMKESNIVDIMRSLYAWPKTQAHPRGTKEVVQALYSIGVPSVLLSNAAVRMMYHTLHEMGEEAHTEASEEVREREEEEEDEVQKQAGEEEYEESSTLYETPLHTSQPPSLTTVRKIEERAPSKSSPSMIPRLERKVEQRETGGPATSFVSKLERREGTAMPEPYPASKASGIPKIPPKRELTKPSTSQTGTGQKAVITEHWFDDPRFPGKPIRVLHMY